MKRTVTGRGWYWTDYRTHRLQRDGGPGRIPCAICGTRPTTTKGLHLDHYPHSLEQLRQAGLERLRWDELDQLTRWLCASCNTRRGSHRSDKRVRQLAAQANNKQQRTNPQTNTNNSTSWRLTPKRTTTDESANE